MRCSRVRRSLLWNRLGVTDRRLMSAIAGKWDTLRLLSFSAHRSLCPVLSFTTKQAIVSSIVHGGGKRRGLLTSALDAGPSPRCPDDRGRWERSGSSRLAKR